MLEKVVSQFPDGYYSLGESKLCWELLDRRSARAAALDLLAERRAQRIQRIYEEVLTDSETESSTDEAYPNAHDMLLYGTGLEELGMGRQGRRHHGFHEILEEQRGQRINRIHKIACFVIVVASIASFTIIIACY